ncbi:hypothetical protein [Rickettsiales endosymbiont of Stachyamoeba lipophora]|nr:hypothetical protein [Rickettsiales endosymbiont of Stachyamoeba lipophora]
MINYDFLYEIKRLAQEVLYPLQFISKLAYAAKQMNGHMEPQNWSVLT